MKKVIYAAVLFVSLSFFGSSCMKEQVKPNSISLNDQLIADIKTFASNGQHSKEEINDYISQRAIKLGGKVRIESSLASVPEELRNNKGPSAGARCQTRLTIIEWSDGTCTSIYDRCDGSTTYYVWDGCSGSANLIGSITYYPY